jgi:hypothetical protein
MEQSLRRFYQVQFPHLTSSAALSGLGLDLRGPEDVAVLRRLVSRDLDTLIPYMLRADIFIEMHLDLYPSLNTKDQTQILLELDRIEREVQASTWYGDGCYLKHANNVKGKGGNQHGNWMLTKIAEGIRAVDCDLYARFRQGDEFVMYHRSTDDVIDLVEQMVQELATYEVLPNLPVAIDFGYARHSEVASTYKRLLSEGWVPQAGRTGTQVFFDIALKMALVRSDVQKVYNRAWLLLGFYREMHVTSPDEYVSLEGSLTRGDRFIRPQPNWLEVSEAKLGDFIRMETLAFLAGDDGMDHFDGVVTEVAESIYLDTIVR